MPVPCTLIKAALLIELIPRIGYFPGAALAAIFVPFPCGLNVLRIKIGIPFSNAGLIDGGNRTLAPKWEISIASL
jgi:hypothetical protein